MAWIRRQPAAGWALAALTGLIGVVIGRDIRWQATSPGLASIGAALEALIVGAAVIVALIAGGLLLFLGRRTVGQMLLMPAVAAAVLTTVGAATGPTFVAAQQWPGEVALTLTSPPGGTISATATCDTPENSTAVRHIAATSIGYLAGERVSVDVQLPPDGTARLVLIRGQEHAPTGVRLATYGAAGGGEVSVTADEADGGGRIAFTGLGPIESGVPWGLGADSLRLDGELRWSCDRDGPQTWESSHQAAGTIEFSGAVSASLPVGGTCGAEDIMFEFQADLSGKGGAPPASGDPVAGVLVWLPAGWELSLFRPGVDPEAEAQRVDTAVVTRLSDADDDAVHQRLVGAFPFSYGTVEVVAEWECAA